MSGRVRDSDKEFVHLARMVAEGRPRDAVALIRRELPIISRDRPDLDDLIRRALAGAANVPSAVRGAGFGEVPADRDTRQDLLWEETSPVLPPELVWPDAVGDALRDIVAERAKELELARAGVAPTRTMLFIGPPGVGKTMAARWLANELGRPLVTLDLATVMSSFLGRTGSNIRAVLDYARSKPSVLLLDEFDAIAKRRDDSTDVGELKRLVTVLLQSIDNWPSSGVLVCATNHPELLDLAVWRRFERVIKFPAPSAIEVKAVVDRVLGNEVDEALRIIASIAFSGRGFADVVNEMTRAKRDAITRGIPLGEALEMRLHVVVSELSRSERLLIARKLSLDGASQRTIQHITGVARDTLRSHGIATAETTKRRSKKEK